MKKYKKVLVAVTDDEFRHTIGVWDSVLKCSRELDIPEMTIRSALLRKKPCRKIKGFFEWLVIEDE